MTLLILSPAYASHYAPLSVIGRAAIDHERVVIATGAGFRARVESDGFEHRTLQLGAESNAGVATLTPAMRRFLDATRAGPVATLRQQAERRAADLLWRPESVAADIGRLCDEIDPDAVLVDHVSFGSTLGMHATGRPYVTLVPGHPTQLPVGAERYGAPAGWPAAIRPRSEELIALNELTDAVNAAFTDRWNAALAAIAPELPPVDDATRVTGHRVLYNSVADLVPSDRRPLLPADHRFVGPLVRDASADPADVSTIDAWRERPDPSRPQVYVAFGTFLSWRTDVLRRVADALRRIDARAAIAVGDADPADLGPVPSDWIVADRLPQVDLLADADVAIHHGGNNSVQECLAVGTPQIVLPFSTDQFANAADLERSTGAVALAPNTASAVELATAVDALTTLPRRPSTAPLDGGALHDAILDSDQWRAPSVA